MIVESASCVFSRSEDVHDFLSDIEDDRNVFMLKTIATFLNGLCVLQQDIASSRAHSVSRLKNVVFLALVVLSILIWFQFRCNANMH